MKLGCSLRTPHHLEVHENDPGTAPTTRENQRFPSGTANAYQLVCAATDLLKTSGEGDATDRDQFESILWDLEQTLLLTRAALRAYADRPKVGLDAPDRDAFMQALDLMVDHFRAAQRALSAAASSGHDVLEAAYRDAVAHNGFVDNPRTGSSATRAVVAWAKRRFSRAGQATPRRSGATA